MRDNSIRLNDGSARPVWSMHRPAVHAPKHTILLIEDQSDIGQLLLDLLREEGYHVEWATTAAEGFSYLEPAPASERGCGCPGLVLLDLTLPDMEQPEIVRRFSGCSDSGALPPVIIMSGKSPQAVHDAATQIRAAGVVRKPFSIDTLLSAVERALPD